MPQVTQIATSKARSLNPGLLISKAVPFLPYCLSQSRRQKQRQPKKLCCYCCCCCSEKFAKGFTQLGREVKRFLLSFFSPLYLNHTEPLVLEPWAPCQECLRLFHLKDLGRWIREGLFALKEIKDLCSILPHQKPLFFMITGGLFWNRTVITRQNCTFSTVQCPVLLMSSRCTAMEKRGSQRPRELF